MAVVMRQTSAARQFVEEFKRVFTADALAQVRERAEEMARAEGKTVLGRSHLRAAWEEFLFQYPQSDRTHCNCRRSWGWT